MNSTMLLAPSMIDQMPQGRLFIEGVTVDELFGRIYEETRELAYRFQKVVRFDLIAWSNLTVAADRNGLTAALVQAIRWCLASPDTRSVTVRSYPCCEDVWAIFDIQVDLEDARPDRPEAWKPTLCALRAAVHRMGGEWEPIASYSDCVRVSFRLPQWILPCHELPRIMLHAS